MTIKMMNVEEDEKVEIKVIDNLIVVINIDTNEQLFRKFIPFIIENDIKILDKETMSEIVMGLINRHFKHNYSIMSMDIL